MYYCINKWHGAQAPTRVDGDGDGGDDGNGGREKDLHTLANHWREHPSTWRLYNAPTSVWL